MLTPVLPPEILRLIVESARHDTPTLLELCLVCRTLLRDAQRVLYADVTISGLPREVIERPSKAMLFLNTTTSYPSLARKVRSLSYYYNGRDLRSDWWERMTRALQNMVNLKSFALTGALLPRATTLFDNCPFKLREFTWIDYGGFGLSDHEDALRRFFATQPEIRSLSLVLLQTTQISPPIFPQLNTLSGDSPTIMRVLPTRQTITKLGLNEVRPPRNALDVELISQGLSHVRTFALGGFISRHHNLVTFIPYLTNVQTIRLFGCASGISLEHELEHISSLSQLRIFIWSPNALSRMDYFRLISEDQQRVLVLRWFRAIPTMHAAYFARCLPKEDAKCYLRWTRDGATSHVAPDEYMRLGNVDS